MAKRIFQAGNQTYAALADTTAATTLQHMTLMGGSTTQLIDVLEIMIEGLASASTVSQMQFARCTTVPGTPTALAAPNSDGPLHPSTAALAAPPVSCVTASTQPQRSANTTDPRLTLNLNLFGGIVRWNAAPTQQWSILGNTQPLGASMLSAFTGSASGAASAHMIYEPY